MIVYSVRSHVGRQRENNEDNLFADGVIRPLESGNRPFSLDGVAGIPSVFAVCDGMGGTEAGEVASFLAAKTLLADREHIQAAGPRQVHQAVQSYIGHAHRAIQQETQGRRSGTTLALAVVSAKGIFCFNLGDSRIYTWRSGCFSQITNDHTTAAERSRSGIPMSEQEQSDFRLTRCVGIGELQSAQAYPAVRRDCRLLICSDGLTDMVAPHEIAHILHTAPLVSDAADGLVQAALKHGGVDNITVIVVQEKQGARFHI